MSCPLTYSWFVLALVKLPPPPPSQLKIIVCYPKQDLADIILIEPCVLTVHSKIYSACMSRSLCVIMWGTYRVLKQFLSVLPVRFTGMGIGRGSADFRWKRKMSAPKHKTVRSNQNVMVLHQVKNWQNWKMQGCFMQFLRLIFVKKLQLRPLDPH